MGKQTVPALHGAGEVATSRMKVVTSSSVVGASEIDPLYPPVIEAILFGHREAVKPGIFRS